MGNDRFATLGDFTHELSNNYPSLKNKFDGLDATKKQSFYNDFKNATNDDLVKLNNDVDLVDTWRKISHVNNSNKKNIDFLIIFNTLDNNTILKDHIFIGDYQAVTGCHYYGAVDGVNVRFVAGSSPVMNSLGVIKCDIEMRKPLLNAQLNIIGYRWMQKNTQGNPQTFFPINWSQDKIIEECASAISNSNKQLVPGMSRMWEGESDSGVFIRWFEDQNGNIKSMFPEF